MLAQTAQATLLAKLAGALTMSLGQVYPGLPQFASYLKYIDEDIDCVKSNASAARHATSRKRGAPPWSSSLSPLSGIALSLSSLE